MKPLFHIVNASTYRSPSMFQHPREGWAVTVRYVGGVLASYRRAAPSRTWSEDRATSVLLRYISKARAAGLELDLCLLPHLERITHCDGGETIPKAPIPITWRQCNPGCAGWLHMEEPHEVQACDECERFTRWDRAAELDDKGRPVPGYVTRDDLAREAHALECGCTWGRPALAPGATPEGETA